MQGALRHICIFWNFKTFPQRSGIFIYVPGMHISSALTKRAHVTWRHDTNKVTCWTLRNLNVNALPLFPHNAPVSIPLPPPRAACCLNGGTLQPHIWPGPWDSIRRSAGKHELLGCYLSFPVHPLFVWRILFGLPTRLWLLLLWWLRLSSCLAV